MSNEDLMKKMTEARLAVQNAKQQAQLHVSAVLRGNEQRLGAFENASAHQLSTAQQRRILAEKFASWCTLSSVNARSNGRQQRAVAWGRAWRKKRVFRDWAAYLRAVLRDKLQATHKAIAAVDDDVRTALKEVAIRDQEADVNRSKQQDAMLDRLTHDAEQEMHAKTLKLEATLRKETER